MQLKEGRLSVTQFLDSVHPSEESKAAVNDECLVSDLSVVLEFMSLVCGMVLPLCSHSGWVFALKLTNPDNLL